MVDNPLLITKLAIPSSHKGELARSHLTARLEEGLAHPLILVSAPAGSGKTTLVSAWARASTIPVAWLSLDEGDRDPTRFLTYVISALKTVAPDLDKSILPLLQTPQPQPIEVALTTLVNSLTEVLEPFVLVLDDYHLLDSSPVQHIVTFLLEHQPPTMRLILITRADPPLPLARLRARRQLVELRAADLNFSEDESAALLTQLMGLELHESDIKALLSRTEGWATGLQLAALSMQGSPDPSHFVTSFTGSHEYIVDYLVDEVLSQQPEDMKRFLLQTSILTHLHGPLCDAVTGREDSADVLAMLDRRNLFVVPLDKQRQWYRYHRLFADVLQQRLHQLSRQDIAGLHQQASRWLAQHGFTLEAVHHALAAGDDEMAVTLVDETAEALLMRSETATLLHWIDQLPDNRVREHPALCAHHAWCLLLSGYPLEATEARLKDVEETEPAMALPLRGFVAFYQGRLSEAQSLAVQALERLSPERQFMRNAAQWIARIARLMSMKLSDVDGQLLQMVSEQGARSVISIMSLCHLAEIRMRQRYLRDASSLYERALSLAVEPQGEPRPIAGMPLMGMGALLYEWNELDEAERFFSDGIELITRWSEIGAFDGHMGLYMVKRARGEFGAALEQIQQAQALAQRFDAAEADDIIVDLAEARLWITEGDLNRASRWADEHGLLTGSTADLKHTTGIGYHLRHHQLLVVARLWMAQKNFAEAMVFLNAMVDAMGNHGWLDSRREIEVQALRALCLHALNQPADAFTALARALDLAEPGGYLRTFVDEGPRMAALLHEAALRGLCPTYTRRLLAAFASETIFLAPEPTAELVEPLSDRELEVLGLMAEGLTNREIAEQLYLAPTTVKVHARNIYGKLDAGNRTQAVARARMLGLLP